MKTSSKSRIAIGVLCSGGLLAASCGGSADELIDQASDALNEIAEEGSSVAENEGSTSDDSTPEEPSTGSTSPSASDDDVEVAVEPNARMPLTGAPLDGADGIPNRPALAVKMPNNRKAMPQTGLNEADIVFEQIINDGVTRFVAVFHSQGSDPVGPIRSGRAQDVDILTNLDSPLFAWSGGNDGVTGVVNNSSLVSLNYVRGFADAYYRRDGRGGAPHNLFSSTDALWSFTPGDFALPPQVFAYMLPDETAVGDPASIIEIDLDSIGVRWDYDSSSGQYLRSQYGEPHMSELSGQVSADNVVVLFVDYQRSPFDWKSPEAQTIGKGQALIFTDGVARAGVWQRTSNADMWNLYTDETLSEPIGLSDGRTWVELPRNDSENVRYVS